MMLLCPATGWPIKIVDQETGAEAYFEYVSYKSKKDGVVQSLRPITKKKAESLEKKYSRNQPVGKTITKAPSLEQLDNDPSLFGASSEPST